MMIGGYDPWNMKYPVTGVPAGMAGVNPALLAQEVPGANMHYVGGTAYFDWQTEQGAPVMGAPTHQNPSQFMQKDVTGMPILEMDKPQGGLFCTVDCKWKEVLRVPPHAISQLTRACSTQRNMLKDKGRKGAQNHPNVCEDYHTGTCPNGTQCKLFHLKRDWLEGKRKPHQDALEQARVEFHRIQKEKKHFTVFCPNLKETLPVPANHMHFTRGLFLREEERAKRQAQHGGKHSESHQNPSVCQLFIKGGGDRQCKWGELCNQAHPHRDWLNQRHDMSVKYVHQCKQEFDNSDDGMTWDALDPDTNERITIPKAHLKFTRGLYAKEYSGNRLASTCMLYLKRYDGVVDGNGCTAGDLCNQVHVDLNWIIANRVYHRQQVGDYDDTKHNPGRYQGVHFPASRRAPKWPAARTPPNNNLKPQGRPVQSWWSSTSPTSSASSAAITVSPNMFPTSGVPTPDKTPPVLSLAHELPMSPWLAKQVSNVSQPPALIETDSPLPGEKNVADWFPKGVLGTTLQQDHQEPPQAPPAPPAPPTPPAREQEEEDDDDDSEEEEVMQHLKLIDDDEDIVPVLVVEETKREESPVKECDGPATPTFKAHVAVDTEPKSEGQAGEEHSPIHCGRKASGQGDADFSPFGFESLTALMADVKPE
eukprot:TRINITY_DN1893_c0_g2_i1.p1 TRINITY_DN1893_c0_g2~~TRINITY_DN1893_c0_g2_i1.p1  ORF type:complete len:696 (+),score=174.67 TRINITY_DN1893_c0_g2_i1:142-2088(+)